MLRAISTLKYKYKSSCCTYANQSAHLPRCLSCECLLCSLTGSKDTCIWSWQRSWRLFSTYAPSSLRLALFLPGGRTGSVCAFSPTRSLSSSRRPRVGDFYLHEAVLPPRKPVRADGDDQRSSALAAGGQFSSIPRDAQLLSSGVDVFHAV